MELSYQNVGRPGRTFNVFSDFLPPRSCPSAYVSVIGGHRAWIPTAPLFTLTAQTDTSAPVPMTIVNPTRTVYPFFADSSLENFSTEFFYHDFPFEVLWRRDNCIVISTDMNSCRKSKLNVQNWFVIWKYEDFIAYLGTKQYLLGWPP